MDMNEKSSNSQQRVEVIKKPYEKPTFRFEEVFVTTALSCGKIAGFAGACLTAGSAS
jgi:hypothetical protein